ncbi:coiled-coil domain-containing protein [Ferrovum myxofaciens]|jgi:archaellum component FlaC|uniref:Uncharacterized protein n=1 Tax=Ferrovum myxofaciens TaxID=416213 RepID=A0A149W0J0_9PROT|nr:hypothetical protein [Ferrovum myxofaciens]KXW59009.1 hypothetical protein FEMY_05320 [Ferrovum myxofaciens]
MSQIINELATIEVSNEVLQQLDLGGICQSFSKNYRNLDNLKNFRSEYEKKNWLMRWWHNDKLRDAQLDSAEVQAEFSKTIGQLMMISIMQSKELSEQQTQLNDQQGKLKTQADGIAEHAGKLQEQHQVLAEQSKKLETLVHEYFSLKGLTEEGAQKLIEIAREVKATKDGMLQEFEARSQSVEAVCAEVQLHMEIVSAQVDERIRLSAEQTQAGIAGVQRETREALTVYEASQRAHQEEVQNALNQGMERLAQSQRETEAVLQSKHADLKSRFSDLFEKHDKQFAAHQEKFGAIDGAVEGLSARSNDLATAIAGAKAGLTSCVEHQQTHHGAMAVFQQEVSKSIKRLHFVAAGLSVVVLGQIWALAHLMK